MSHIKGIIFDLDGTLLDSLSFIASCVNRSLVKHALPQHSTATYRHFIGDGVASLARRSLPRDQKDNHALINQITAEIKASYLQVQQNDLTPYPGVIDLLRDLHDLDIKLAILSNKVHEHALQCVAMFLGDKYFNKILGAAEGRPLKPDPAGIQQILREWAINKDQLLYVGDMALDIQTGKSAGVGTVAVSWGFGDRAELQNLQPDFLVDNTQQLLAIVG